MVEIKKHPDLDLNPIFAGIKQSPQHGYSRQSLSLHATTASNVATSNNRQSKRGACLSASGSEVVVRRQMESADCQIDPGPNLLQLDPGQPPAGRLLERRFVATKQDELLAVFFEPEKLKAGNWFNGLWI